MCGWIYDVLMFRTKKKTYNMKYMQQIETKAPEKDWEGNKICLRCKFILGGLNTVL